MVMTVRSLAAQLAEQEPNAPVYVMIHDHPIPLSNICEEGVVVHPTFPHGVFYLKIEEPS